LRDTADVRAVPRSRRNPQFNQESLPGELAKADTACTHLASFGGLRGRRKDLAAGESPNGGWENAAFRNYADYALTQPFREGLAELEELGAAPTVIMRAEALWWSCHRRIISDYLTLRGWSVLHLMPLGQAAAPRPHALRRASARRYDFVPRKNGLTLGRICCAIFIEVCCGLPHMQNVGAAVMAVAASTCRYNRRQSRTRRLAAMRTGTHVARVALVLLALAAFAGCAINTAYFRPEPGVTTTTSSSGHRAAYYVVKIGGADVGTLDIWSRGAYPLGVQGGQVPVLDVRLGVHNDGKSDMMLDVDHTSVAFFHNGSLTNTVKDVYRMNGPDKVAPGSVAHIQLLYALPVGMTAGDVDAFDLNWQVSNEGGSFAESTPFLQNYYYDYGYPYYPYYYYPYYWGPYWGWGWWPYWGSGLYDSGYDFGPGFREGFRGERGFRGEGGFRGGYHGGASRGGRR
jgi:hypothetical protein